MMYPNFNPNQKPDSGSEPHTYSYERYGGGWGGPQTQPGTFTVQTPQSQAQTAPAPRKTRKAPRMIAAVLGVALLAGGVGGGSAWFVLNNWQSAEPASTVLETAVEEPVPTIFSGGAADISGVVSKVSGSVVEIVTSMPGNPFYFRQTQEGAGSGVVVGQDGYIVTNNHVVSGAREIQIRTEDGTEYAASLVGTDQKTDLAVIKVEATGLRSVTFADSDSVQVGQAAIAIGNPLGQLGGTVTSGIISATGREITIDGETMHLLQTSAAINPGNSGGGLFDEHGKLVGIVNAKSSGINIEGLGFAIPSNTVKEVIDDIIENGYVTGRPQLGISVIEVTDPYALTMYRLQEPGVYIASDENPAGLRAGDRIVSLDGKEITASAQIAEILSNHAVGDTLTLVARRGEEDLSVQVTLTERVPEEMQSVQRNEI